MTFAGHFGGKEERKEMLEPTRPGLAPLAQSEEQGHQDLKCVNDHRCGQTVGKASGL